MPPAYFGTLTAPPSVDVHCATRVCINKQYASSTSWRVNMLRKFVASDGGGRGGGTERLRDNTAQPNAAFCSLLRAETVSVPGASKYSSGKRGGWGKGRNKGEKEALQELSEAIFPTAIKVRRSPWLLAIRRARPPWDAPALVCMIGWVPSPGPSA